MREPDARLRPLMHRPLLGFEQHGASFSSWLEPPRPALTLMIDVEGSLQADGGVLPSAWMAGLGERYTVVGFGPRYASVDLELTPLGAYVVAGLPLSELRAQTVRLEDVFGDEGRVVSERVRSESDWGARLDVIESFLLARAAAGPRVDPAVAWAWDLLVRSAGRVRVEAVAAEIGCSRRYLHARFSAQVGLGPKRVARLIRFRFVCRAIEQAPLRWAEVAAAAGYSDQSHLNRDFRELAGTTPGDFVARLVPGGGVVGDEIPFVQDTDGARS